MHYNHVVETGPSGKTTPGTVVVNTQTLVWSNTQTLVLKRGTGDGRLFTVRPRGLRLSNSLARSLPKSGTAMYVIARLLAHTTFFCFPIVSRTQMLLHLSPQH